MEIRLFFQRTSNLCLMHDCNKKLNQEELQLMRHSCEVHHSMNSLVLYRMLGHLSHCFCFLKDRRKRF